MSEAEPLLRALARVREQLLSTDGLVKAVGSGQRRGPQVTPAPWRRVECRYVELKAGLHLQVTRYDATQAHTANFAVGDAARDAVDELLDMSFANWNLETTHERWHVRVTKRGSAHVDITERLEPVDVDRGHDRAKERLLDPGDPLFAALGLADEQGRLKESRMAKYRQVEDFLRILDPAISDAIDAGHLRRPTADDPLRIVDLGCGNAYLTFSAHRFLTDVRDLPVAITGVDVKQQSRDHNADVAQRLGISADFVVGTNLDVDLERAPDVVLALHACDTATDEALERAVSWGAPVVLAAPCCHHDISVQLRKQRTPAPYAALTRHGIVRERFADTLTDALRASLMRLSGYRVDMIEFVGSEHTPRNTLLRATRTGSPITGGSLLKEYEDLVETWGLTPRLAQLLDRASSSPV